MSFSIVVHKKRTIAYSGTIKDAAGTAVTLAADDVLRFKIGRRNTIELEIDNVATANGSIISIDEAASGTYDLTIAQEDADGLSAGPHEAEINVVDNSDSDYIKMTEQGTVLVLETIGGEVGL